jgi:2-succinyl-5-enolpyruvyl-6-hydroxy-3-cyclohexene-1-carboxylate synthase
MRFALGDIQKVFFCTGARNHAILKLLDPSKIDFEYDERMASFKALGLSRVSQSPVVVCTTSGTAVAQTIGALLEATYSDLPLVLISGDRPKKLHGTGAPQTIHHEGLTKAACKTFIEIDIADLPGLVLENPEYPIHINVLVDDSSPHDLKIEKVSEMSSFEEFIQSHSKTLFIFSHEARSMRPLIEEFAKKNLPFYAESLSGGRDLSTLQSEKQLINLMKNREIDSVVRIGHTPLTKIWRLMETYLIPVFSFDSRDLPGASYGKVFKKSAPNLLNDKGFWKAIELTKPLQVTDQDNLQELISKYPDSEPAWMLKLQNSIATDAIVYLGNSLVIRFFELVQKKKFKIHASRGVNGIDGQLSTAIGLAQGGRETVYCILGDITTLYDLSALREMPVNLKLIIINNKGGRIFDMLKLDKRIVMEHEKDFADLARGFHRAYALNDLSLQAQVTELQPKATETDKFLQDWNS